MESSLGENLLLIVHFEVSIYREEKFGGNLTTSVDIVNKQSFGIRIVEKWIPKH